MADLENRTLIDALIEEQQALSAVERFSREHEQLTSASSRYRQLLPATPLQLGEQYAFEVDLDKCSGCKACVTACHSLNGLDENETWREVGLLVEAPKPRRNRVEAPARFTQSTTLQHITTACHHCVDPACLNGCPVLAYDKDLVTGIVRHLDDQCIGCQYCVLKCPYNVPKYNSRLGIVRKCDMCSSRLAVREAPACAQACPNEAIRITKVQTETVTIGFRDRTTTLLAGAPTGEYTLPTTRYVTARGSADVAVRAPSLVPADFADVKPQPAHWPLVLMLVFTQASVGAACVSVLPTAGTARVVLLVGALGFAMVGLGVSVFHLGRPLGAWRGFLNVRRSWMSREIVVFGAYPALLATALILPSLAPVAAITGLVGAVCSAMIYVDTRRELWRARRTLPLFLLTTSMLGAASALVLLPTNVWFVSALVVLTLFKLLVEVCVVRHATSGDLTPMRKSALLATSSFQTVSMGRLAAALVGGVGIPVLLTTNALAGSQVFAALGLALLVLGELCERYLFFRCVVAPKMPGGLPT